LGTAGKVSGMWRWPLTSKSCRGQECVALYLHFFMCHDEGQSYGYRISLFLRLRQVLRLSVPSYILLHVLSSQSVFVVSGHSGIQRCHSHRCRIRAMEIA
jgi:hypothetical protein